VLEFFFPRVTPGQRFVSPCKSRSCSRYSFSFFSPLPAKDLDSSFLSSFVPCLYHNRWASLLLSSWPRRALFFFGFFFLSILLVLKPGNRLWTPPVAPVLLQRDLPPLRQRRWAEPFLVVFPILPRVVFPFSKFSFLGPF